jgi:hypothetical protein
MAGLQCSPSYVPDYGDYGSLFEGFTPNEFPWASNLINTIYYNITFKTKQNACIFILVSVKVSNERFSWIYL